MKANKIEKQFDTDVLIAGGGPTGLVMAAELARRGVSCRIVDLERGPTDKSKAIGIQSRTMELFENMGIVNQFVARGLQMKGATIYDSGAQIVHVPFTDLHNNYPYLLMIPQSETEDILISNLERYNVNVERKTKLISFNQDDEKVTAILEHADGKSESVTAQWLVGCDGAHSAVRHLLNMPFEGNEYEDGFQLADVEIDWELKRDQLHLIIYKGWLMAAFPLPGEGNRYRLLLDVPAENAPKEKTPTLQQLQAVVDERSHVKAILSNPKWTSNYKIHRRIVSELRAGRVFLAGDAAHIHSPAAAQGMNTGIQDVFNLAWKLALVVKQCSPESILDSYHLERYPVEQDVLKRSDLLLKMVSLKNPFLIGVRDLVAPLLTGFHIVKKYLAKEISELAVEYKSSPIVRDHKCGGYFQAGERLPDARFPENVTGEYKSIFDLLGSGKFLLLLFCGENPDLSIYADLYHTAKTAKAYDKGQLLTCLVKKVDYEIVFDCGDVIIVDSELSFTKHYTSKEACVYLIRPDGYIAFCSESSKAAENIESYLPLIFSAS